MKLSYIALAGALSLACGGIVVDGPPEPASPEPSAFCQALALRMTDRYLRQYPEQADLRDQFIQANLDMCAPATVSGPYPDSVSVTFYQLQMEDEHICSEVLAVDSSENWNESSPPYYLLCMPK